MLYKLAFRGIVACSVCEFFFCLTPFRKNWLRASYLLFGVRMRVDVQVDRKPGFVAPVGRLHDRRHVQLESNSSIRFGPVLPDVFSNQKFPFG
jgi:hypothetical protein